MLNVTRTIFIESTNSNCGEMGATTEYTDIEGRRARVGDIVVLEALGQIITQPISMEENGKVFIMGLERRGGYEINKARIIIPHYLVTKDILKYTNPNLVIKEAKTLTIKEIEKELGYPIKIDWEN